MQPYGLQLTRLLCPWDSPGKNTGVGCHALLQRTFLTQGLNPCLSLALAGRLFATSTTWRILKEMGIPDHLTPLLRNLYADQEATVRTGHRTTDWFQIGKGVCQGYILSSCLFNLYAGYIMRNAGLDEAQAGIKISGRNINNLRYADDMTLMAESEEELKSLLMKVRGERKHWPKDQHLEN